MIIVCNTSSHFLSHYFINIKTEPSLGMKQEQRRPWYTPLSSLPPTILITYTYQYFLFTLFQISVRKWTTWNMVQQLDNLKRNSISRIKLGWILSLFLTIWPLCGSCKSFDGELLSAKYWWKDFLVSIEMISSCLRLFDLCSVLRGLKSLSGVVRLSLLEADHVWCRLCGLLTTILHCFVFVSTVPLVHSSDHRSHHRSLNNDNWIKQTR